MIALTKYARNGDAVIVHSLNRLARNLDDLRRIVRELTDKGVKVEFIKENLIFKQDNASPMVNLMLSVMGGFAEFERSLIRERQREGIALAKAKGVYKGRKKALSAEQEQSLKNAVAAGKPKAQIAREFGISRDAAYKYL